MDNQVLPPGVTPESAEKEGWWFKGDYIINQLNTNSAIWSPAHDEAKLLSYENDDGSLSEQPTGKFEMGGYAYTGNGTKIHRVEVSSRNVESSGGYEGVCARDQRRSLSGVSQRAVVILCPHSITHCFARTISFKLVRCPSTTA